MPVNQAVLKSCDIIEVLQVIEAPSFLGLYAVEAYDIYDA